MLLLLLLLLLEAMNDAKLVRRDRTSAGYILINYLRPQRFIRWTPVRQSRTVAMRDQTGRREL